MKNLIDWNKYHEFECEGCGYYNGGPEHYDEGQWKFCPMCGEAIDPPEEEKE